MVSYTSDMSGGCSTVFLMAEYVEKVMASTRAIVGTAWKCTSISTTLDIARIRAMDLYLVSLSLKNTIPKMHTISGSM